MRAYPRESSSRVVASSALFLGLALSGCPSPQQAPAVQRPASAPARSRSVPAPQEVCTGLEHSCGRTGGAVACWGDNTRHQIAPTDEPQIERPRIVSALPPAAELRCGAFETCVRTSQGTVHCLGGGRGIDRLSLPGPARDLVLHESGGCVLLEAGRILCWSRPALDAKGRPLRELAPAVGATAFARGVSYADVVCLLRGDQAPACVQGLLPSEKPAVRVLPGWGMLGVRSLLLATAQGAPLCAWLKDRRLGCMDPGWLGSVAHPPLLPADLRVDDLVGVFSGGFCVRENGRPLRCVGEPSALVRNVPPAARQIAFSHAHACAMVGGEFRCWGSASRGQLGGAERYLHLRPAKVPGVDHASQIDASELQVCVVQRGGAIRCWGQHSRGGAKITTDFAPRAFSVPGPALEVRASGFAASGESSLEPLCVRQTAGWSCLRDTWGPRPAARSPLTRFGAALRLVSRDLQCGVTTADHLVCAGAPFFTTTKVVKTRLLSFAPEERFVEATSLLQHERRQFVCGRTRSRKVQCFAVEEGHTARPVGSPTVEALAGVVQLRGAAYGEDSGACALTEAGVVWCWGDGRFGQLGGAIPPDFFAAVRIPNLPPVAEIAVGGAFACARTAQGEVYCWGSNRNGTAPDGATGVHRDPVSAVWPSR